MGYDFIYNSSEMEAISLKGTFGLGSADFIMMSDIEITDLFRAVYEMGVSEETPLI